MDHPHCLLRIHVHLESGQAEETVGLRATAASLAKRSNHEDTPESIIHLRTRRYILTTIGMTPSRLSRRPRQTRYSRGAFTKSELALHSRDCIGIASAATHNHVVGCEEPYIE